MTLDTWNFDRVPVNSDDHEMQNIMTETLIRLERAHRRGTGCHLDAAMVHRLAISHLGEPMYEAYEERYGKV